jgi:hypothetical protein
LLRKAAIIQRRNDPMKKNLATFLIAAIVMLTIATSPKGHGFVEQENGPWWSPGTWATWVLNYVESIGQPAPKPTPAPPANPAATNGDPVF